MSSQISLRALTLWQAIMLQLSIVLPLKSILFNILKTENCMTLNSEIKPLIHGRHLYVDQFHCVLVVLLNKIVQLNYAAVYTKKNGIQWLFFTVTDKAWTPILKYRSPWIRYAYLIFQIKRSRPKVFAFDYKDHADFYQPTKTWFQLLFLPGKLDANVYKCLLAI